MKSNFLNRYYDPLSTAASAASTAIPGVGPALAAAQGVLGIIQTVGAANRSKRLMQQRKAYQTPQEFYDILNATQSMAQSGFDPFTLNFMTGQVDRAFSSTIGAATRLGADPNDLSGIFDQKMQAIMKIGADNHALNLENFSKFLAAKSVIGENKAAEWKSQQDIIKDQLQSAAAEKQAGIQNIGSAANAFLSFSAANRTSQLYGNSRTGNTRTSNTTNSGVGYAPDFDNYNQPG